MVLFSIYLYFLFFKINSNFLLIFRISIYFIRIKILNISNPDTFEYNQIYYIDTTYNILYHYI